MSQLHDALKARLYSSAVAAPSFAAKTEMPVAVPADVPQLNASLYGLTQACAEVLARSVEHFRTDGAWMMGTMPSCAEEADRVESLGRGFLAHSQLPHDQIELVTRLLRDAADLRAVARCARHAAQLSWLLRQEAHGKDVDALLAHVHRAGAVAVSLARRSALAVANQGAPDATWIALRCREFDSARRDAEHDLAEGALVAQFPPTLRRMTRAAVWYMVIAAECMARLCVRATLGVGNPDIL